MCSSIASADGAIVTTLSLPVDGDRDLRVTADPNFVQVHMEADRATRTSFVATLSPMAKKKSKKKTGRRGGGRTPGAWTLLTQDALKTFRTGAKLSRSRLSELLGVSSTSVQNWETGRSVPLTRYQEQIVALMEGGVPADTAPARKRGSNGAARSRGGARSNGASHALSSSGDAALTAVGDILKGYLATPAGGELGQEQLVALAMSLRAALS